MEEDVEIDMLYKTHGKMLMEAAAAEISEYEEQSEEIINDGENFRGGNEKATGGHETNLGYCNGESIEEGKEKNSEHCSEERSGGVCAENCKLTNTLFASNKQVSNHHPVQKRKKRKKRLAFSKGSKKTKRKRENIDYDITNLQDVLDTKILNLKMEQGNKSLKFDDSSDDDGNSYRSDSCSERDNESLQFMNEILGDNVPEIHNKKEISEHLSSKYIFELNSIQEMILVRNSLLEELETKLKKELLTNDDEQRQIREKISKLTYSDVYSVKEPSLTRCFFKKFGMPYFQDSSGFPAPQNDDAKRKLKLGELVITKMPRLKYWTKTHKDILQDAVQTTLLQEKSEKLIKEINKLKKLHENVTDLHLEKEILDKITKCQEQLKNLKTLSFLDLVANEKSDREYDWLKYSASDLNGAHSSEECRRFWHVYLKPTVNKSSWGIDEDRKLSQLAEEFKFQDWDSIAKGLGTGRTAFQCFIHYQSRVRNKKYFLTGKWTKEEDEKLLRIIESSQMGDFIPWTKVASFMGDRNHTQIYNRYVNCLDPKLVKGKFSREEDLLIVSGVEVFGFTYQEMASLMNSRSACQIRERYERHLMPKTSKIGTFSLEEDEELLRLIEKYGKKNFFQVAKEMKTRSRTQVRHRYNFIVRMMETKPGWTPASVKRRCLNSASKVLMKTQQQVELVKKEVEHVEKIFQMSKLESDTFRVEKLKELRDKIFMKNLDLKRKKKRILTKKSGIDKQLLEFFKNYNANGSFKCTKHEQDYGAFFNEILLLSKYFGHDLQLPQSKSDILLNQTLSQKLKLFLIKVLKLEEDGSEEEEKTRSCEETAASSKSKSLKIDYVAPENDDTMHMMEWWHDPPVNVAKLNFSEMFKRTVFDYSSGMHQDIWDSKMRQSKVIHEYFVEDKKPPSDQQYFFPPNIITTSGYKSLLLSRTRLKRDAIKGDDSHNTQNIRDDPSLTYDLVDKFQETLLTLFYCPKVLSLTNITSTSIPPVKSKKKSKRTSPEEEIASLLNQSNQNNSDIVKKVAQPLKDDVLREKKMERVILKHNQDRQRQLKERKQGITCNRKMNVEHLVNKIGESNETFISSKNIKTVKSNRARILAWKNKRKRLMNSNNPLKKSKPKPKPTKDVDNVVQVTKVLKTYSRNSVSLKSPVDSDKSSDPTKTLVVSSGSSMDGEYCLRDVPNTEDIQNNIQ